MPTSTLPSATGEIVVDASAVVQEPPYVRFPPFPDVPEGVTIIPFKKFREHGIQMFTGDGDVELDGLGIETVELRVKHDTDECKTNAKRKRKKKPEERAAAASMRKEWWEHWKEGEDLRLTSVNYDPNIPRVDRLFQAAYDFRVGRTWPPAPTGVRALWDQFRLFVGLLANTPIWRKAEAANPAQDNVPDADDDISDDDLGSGSNSKLGSTTNLVMDEESQEGQQRIPRRRPRPPYANYGEEGPEVKNDDQIKELLDDEALRKEEKLNTFLNDPERTTKIFLSSYMRKQGLIWSDRNLFAIPHLLSFFFNFLIRNRVLPEPTHERGLRRALEVIELSRTELPLTAKIAKILPDDFSQACQACWGIKADGYKRLLPDDEADNEDVDEPGAKRTKLDNGDTAAVDQFEEELKAANVEVLKPGPAVVMADAVKEAIEDNMEATDGGGWGSGWGDSEFEPASLTSPTFDPWAPQTFDWTPPVVYSLFSLLGPTTLPVTHTTGVVEWSLRKIKSLTPPPTILPRSLVTSEGDTEADAEAVEVELERRFAKIVLGPWLGWDSTEDPLLSRPRILETSKGAVILDSDKAAAPQPAPTKPAGEVKPHDPLKDDITIFVEPTRLASLSIGMGLGGTWVQIARQEDVNGKSDGPAKRKKKNGKGKAKKSEKRYWYMDELMMIFPSYYTS